MKIDLEKDSRFVDDILWSKKYNYFVVWAEDIEGEGYFFNAENVYSRQISNHNKEKR